MGKIEFHFNLFCCWFLGRVNFNCVTGIYFYWSKQAMFTVSILFFILISNTYGIWDGVLELSTDPLQSIPLLFWNSWIRHRYVCSFWVLSHSRILNSFGDVTITVEGLQITFDLYSALMIHWAVRFFSLPHLLWQEASVFNGHLRGHVTLTPVAELLAMELSLPNFTSGLSRLGSEHPTFRVRGERSIQLSHRRGPQIQSMCDNLL